MDLVNLDDQVTVSGQITTDDLADIYNSGARILVCNRPDGEAQDQTDFAIIEAEAVKLGFEVVNLPFSAGNLSEDIVDEFAKALSKGEKIHAYCRTGNRCTMVWNAAREKTGESANQPEPAKTTTSAPVERFDIVIIGGGSGGIALSKSLLKRQRDLRIAIIEPSAEHYYQPGWTMVGGGVFSAASTMRNTANLIDNRVSWIQHKAELIQPQDNKVTLDNGHCVCYSQLVVAPGLVIDWGAIDGLEATLGQNGVTSNYRYDLAPYTWELVQQTKKGTALFTQPPMPIKCAGAPQKAMYLSSDQWFKKGLLKDINVEFCNAGAVLFGVPDYVPALMEYVKKYDIDLQFNCNLTKVDGPAKKAWFNVTDADGKTTEVCKSFDMLHVCPPQKAPDFITQSGLADEAGWLNVDANTLRHSDHNNIWGVGDVMNTTNAKTMAAVRKQVPVLANNIMCAIQGKPITNYYDGYGSCPLTVERGKIVLAEFCYGGRISPTFPKWLNKGTQPTLLAWWLKAHALPPIYWKGMLKGHEWLTKCSPGQ